MKICWDNLSLLYYNNGVWSKKSQYFIYKDCCEICNEPYLTNKYYPSNYCSRSCCHIGKPPGNKGIPISEETRKILKEKLSGANHPGYGKTRSKETKDKIRKTKLGSKNPMYRIGKTTQCLVRNIVKNLYTRCLKSSLERKCLKAFQRK